MVAVVQRGEVRMVRWLMVVCLTLVWVGPTAALEPWNGLVINEVYYYPPGADMHNEFIELMNTDGTPVSLDGAVITDEGDDGMPEGVYRFPGRRGGHTIMMGPHETLLIAVDAVWGGIEPDLSTADWEFWHPGDDNDNPDVPNIVLCSGSDADPAFANSGDGVLIATGEDSTASIDCRTVVDGVNWGNVPDPVPISWLDCLDPAFAEPCPQGNTIGRCPQGVDHNVSSDSDWVMSFPTPGAPNIPSYPSECATPVERLSWGRLKALYRP
jgi:hypothetical protein